MLDGFKPIFCGGISFEVFLNEAKESRIIQNWVNLISPRVGIHVLGWGPALFSPWIANWLPTHRPQTGWSREQNNIAIFGARKENRRRKIKSAYKSLDKHCFDQPMSRSQSICDYFKLKPILKGSLGRRYISNPWVTIF